MRNHTRPHFDSAKQALYIGALHWRAQHWKFDRIKAMENHHHMAEFFKLQPFVQALEMQVVACASGTITVEMPFLEAHSTPPNLFPASIVGALGDVAAVSACTSCLPVGWVAATLDFTVKMTGKAAGDKLIAHGRVLQSGRTTSVGIADIYAFKDGAETHCGTVIATARVFQIK